MRIRRGLCVGGISLAVALSAWGIAWHQMSKPTPISGVGSVESARARVAAANKAAIEAERRQAATRRAAATRPRRPAPLPAWPPVRTWTDSDERQVASLIAAMGSSDFATREDAARRLKGVGPEVVPALQRYRDHEDPEIAGRIRAIIDAFAWMNRGAIVVHLQPNGPADALGIKAGDVIVKVDDAPVLGFATVAQTHPDRERTLSIWRGGRVLTVKVPAGLMGVNLSDWDTAKGGSDQARGLAVLLRRDKPDPDEAYARLRQARDAGMTDGWSTAILASLAAQRLDHAYAMECYRAFRAPGGVACDWTHLRIDDLFHHLPFDSPHSAFLLEQYRTQPWSPGLYHELIDWFCRNGRNYPMLGRVLGKPPVGVAMRPEFRRYDTEARLKVDAYERRWADALRDYDDGDPGYVDSDDGRHRWAIVAAIHAGRIDKAVDVAAPLLESYRRNNWLWPLAGDTWCAIEAAGAAGDAAGVKRLSDLVRSLPPGSQSTFANLFEEAACLNVGAAEYTLPLFADLARARRAQRVRAAYFALLGACPKTTADEFRKAWDGRLKAEDNVPLKRAAAAGFLRFGLYDDVLALWAADRAAAPAAPAAPAGKNEDAPDRAAVAVGRTVEFARANEQRLRTDWSELRGLIQAIRGPQPDTWWVLRWDGGVFFIDAAGKPHRYPGLPRPPAPLRAGDYYLSFDRRTGAVTCEFPYPAQAAFPPFFRLPTPTPLYVLDPANGRWVNTYQADCGVDPISPTAPGDAAARAAVMRYVNKTYPLPAGEAPRRYQELMGRNDFWFEGNLRIRCRPGDHAITDLSAEVAKAAGLDRPAQVYDVGRTTGPTLLILTDVGLFTETRTAGIERVELPGLKDQNVHVCWLDSQDYDDGTGHTRRLIGVAPQDGGQVFEMDEENHPIPTGGFCGKGPRDWFDTWFNADSHTRPPIADAIQRLYLKRAQADR